MLASSCPYGVRGAPFGFFKSLPIEFKALLLDSMPPHWAHHVLVDFKVPSVIVNHCKNKFANSPMSRWLQDSNSSLLGNGFQASRLLLNANRQQNTPFG